MKTSLTFLRITLLFIFSSAGLTLTAQNKPGQIHCPSDDMTDSLIAHDPVWARSYFYMEQKIRERENAPVAERTTEIYTLPVVVHVIHEGEPIGSGSNISDQQIISAINALNQDYRHITGTNGDGNGPDVGIEFCLAVRDPNGNPTTGIVRVNGSSVTDYADKGIMTSSGNGADEVAVKSLSAWPRTSYMNIWVVNEIGDNNAGSGVQGYAYFPFNSVKDGIVILYNAFGTTGNLKSYTNLNRTLTHEVGHYLGLYHTFNDTSTCTSETSCSTQGDRVCDTPPTILNSSCGSRACSGTQQIENYMDYTGQTCQDMFSEGQKLRMRTTLETQRTSMLSSLGCTPVNNRDAGITAVLQPSGMSCSTSYTPSVVITNFGNNTLTSAIIHYNVDGVGSSTFNWTGNLTTGTNATVTLPTITAANGSHTFYAWTTSPNGQADQNSSNDQSTSTFEVASGSTVRLVVKLDFFGAETTWRITHSNGTPIANGGPYVNNQQGLEMTENVCLPDGCYVLTFFDVYGDGQSLTSGGFTLYDENDVILASASGNWGAQVNKNFCVTGTTVVGTPPTASFTIPDAIVCIAQQTSFTNTSTGSPTSYSWTFENGSPATSTQANPSGITWAAAGTYDVTLTVTNSDGSNTYVCSNCITVAGGPTVTLTPTSPTCNGTSNGSITANATGSYTPFTYSWNTGVTTANISNLGAGSFTLTVTNAQGCTSSKSATLSMPAALVVSGTTTPPSCNGASNGSITATATGGTGSKIYTWNNAATGATINNLSAGTYIATVKDANNCSANKSFSLVEPSALQLTVTPTHISCGVGTGSATAAASGGTAPYTITWSNSATGTSITGLTAGNYSATVTDSKGCTKTAAFSIQQTPGLTVAIVATGISCAGGNNGSLTAQITGGAAPFTYNWNNSVSTAVNGGLSAGTYTVNVSDANGCTGTKSYTLNNPAALTLTVTPVNISCGAGAGSATAAASGGTGPYTITWSNSTTGTSSSGLAAGNYSATVTDNKGCTKTTAFTIQQTPGLTVAIVATDISCAGGNDGSLAAQVSGGTAPFSYSWNNSTSTAANNGLSAGTYTVNVSDANGCSGSKSHTLNSPDALQLTITPVNISCGAGTGSATAAVSGGTGSYTITWSNSTTGPSVSGLTAGNYSATVADSKGCTKTTTFDIEESAALSVALVVEDISCQGVADGHIEAQPQGGTAPFTYQWTDGPALAEHGPLGPGIYHVLVTDANGCTGEAQMNLQDPQALSLEIQAIDVSCNGAEDGSLTATVSGGTGSLNYAWSTGENATSLNNLAAGSYSLTVSDENGCSIVKSEDVTEPTALSGQLSLTHASCGGSGGAAQLALSGGTTPYSIIWSNGESGDEITGISEGTYEYTVTDAEGCSLSESFAIESSGTLNVSIHASPISCHGASDGMLTVSPDNGVAPFTYQWSTGEDSQTIQGVGHGTYTVIVTDLNGCSGQAEVVLNGPAPVEISLIKSDVSCFEANDGFVEAIATGGTGSISTEWSTGTTGNSIHELAAGIYTAVVSDENGCSVSESIEVESPAAITLNVELIEAESCAGNDGIAIADASGGSGILQYDWSSGSSGTQLNGASEGTYEVTVSDANGCTATAQVVIPRDCIITIPGTQLSEDDCGIQDAELSESVSCIPVENAGAYQWRWTDDLGNLIDEPLTSSTYLMLSDVNGIETGSDYHIQVRAQVNGEWGAYGETCMLTTASVVIAGPTQVMEEDCGSTILEWGGKIRAYVVEGAINYEWNFVGPDYEWTSYTLTNEFEFGTTMMFEPGHSYAVKVRCALGGGVFTEWGESCSLFFDEVLSASDNEAVSDHGTLLFYPNPGNGAEIMIDGRNLSSGAVVQSLCVYNAAGQLTESMYALPNLHSSNSIQYSFRHPLAPGMYVIHYTVNGMSRQEKLLVR